MECSELVGYVASALVFATFYMNSMTLLRVFALTSNCAFIAYACLGELFPILALHVALLPLNAWRLLQSMREDTSPMPTTIGPDVQGLSPQSSERTRTAETP
jgi:CRP/FNR family transcriptional regulator, cyclic AMP receptor protein